MRVPTLSLLTVVMACASAPQTRAPSGESPDLAREAAQPPVAAAVAEVPAAAPTPAVTVAPAEPVAEVTESAPASVASAASKPDCEKLVEHIDTVALMEQTGSTVVTPNLQPSWHKARVRACTSTVDERVRDCLLKAKDLKSADRCKSSFFAETIKSYRIR
jgi:hypothetical protein